MKINGKRLRVCPICGNHYKDVPAISRKDNKTLICPDCGTRQALASLGVTGEEADKILGYIHGTCKAHK